jgi:hypothetical protein
MKKKLIQTRIIKVTHPLDKSIILFECEASIFNMNPDLVERIEGIEVKYSLKKPKMKGLEA